MNQGLLVQGNRPIAMPSGIAERAKRVPTPVGAPRLAENDHTLNGEYFSVSLLTGAMTIGMPGRAGFGVAYDRSLSRPYEFVLHPASRSVVGDIPSVAAIVVADPFADSTASGFTFDGDPFPIPEDGYSIGTAGALYFGIAFDLDASEAIIDPIHTASLSVM